MSANSSRRRAERQRGFPMICRKCGEEAEIFTSKTLKNPGRIFHGCPNSSEEVRNWSLFYFLVYVLRQIDLIVFGLTRVDKCFCRIRTICLNGLMNLLLRKFMISRACLMKKSVTWSFSLRDVKM